MTKGKNTEVIPTQTFLARVLCKVEGKLIKILEPALVFQFLFHFWKLGF